MSRLITNYLKFLEKTLVVSDLPLPVSTSNPTKRGNVLINKIEKGEKIKKGDGKEVKIDKMKDDRGTWVDPDEVIDDIKDEVGDYDHEIGKDYFAKFNVAGKVQRYKSVFKGDDESDFTLNQIQKTQDFGSKGAGRLTAQNEIVQSIFIALKLSDPEIDLLPSNIPLLFSKFMDGPDIMVASKEEELRVLRNIINSDYLTNEDWVETLCEIPNLLWDRGYLKSKNYKLFHTSANVANSPYIVLKSKFYELCKKSNLSNINFNKYCPGDVFLIDKNVINEFNEEVRRAQDLDALSIVCEDYFMKELFKPISLKMVKLGKNFDIIINNERGADLPEFKLSDIIINSDFKGIFSKITAVSKWERLDYSPNNSNNQNEAKKIQTFYKRTINFDSPDSTKKNNIDGEIEGSTSRHGRIALSAIKRIIKSYREKFTVDDVNELVPYSLEELQEEILNMNKLIGDLCSELGFSTINYSRRGVKNLIQMEMSSDTIAESWEKKYEERKLNLILTSGKGTTDDEDKTIKNNKYKLISRLQSLQLVFNLLNIYSYNPSKADLILTKIMRYALSIEIMYGAGRGKTILTPMYLRII